VGKGVKFPQKIMGPRAFGVMGAWRGDAPQLKFPTTGRGGQKFSIVPLGENGVESPGEKPSQGGGGGGA